MFDLIVVCGPTASGKSELALQIADKFNGEIISADSMQIYKEMNIGTAKPSEQEQKKIKHHLIDFLNVDQEYSVSQFCSDARQASEDILSRKKIPVLVGGTGLYIDSFVNNLNFQNSDGSQQIREKLINELNEKGIDYLFDLLVKIDPEASCIIHKNNTKRVIRALELNFTTGKNLSQINAESLRNRKFNPLFIGVNYKDRALLYDRINLRVDYMIENGLIEEAKKLFEVSLSKTAIGAIGYKELFEFFKGDLTLEDSVELLKQKTRNYAKRQITWFKRNKEINWFFPDEFDSRQKFIDSVLEFIDSEV